MERSDDLLALLYPSAARRERVAMSPPSRNGNGQKPELPAEQFLDIEPPPAERTVPFPVEALPIGLTAFVLDTARAMEVEPEMIAIPALVCLGAAIGDSRCLRLKHGYEESAMLWATVVARPGSVKTSAILATAEPLRRWERHLDAENRKQRQWYEQDLERWQATRSADRQGEARPVEPKAARQIVRDVTMEELAYILRDNPRGLLMLQDEMSGWVRAMNQYKRQGADRSNWLSIWSSVEITVDRRSAHGDPLRVWHPFVSVTGGIQPDLLRELRPENGADDGLIDRILFAWPAQRVRRWTEATVPQWAIDQYRAVFARLLALAQGPDDLGYPHPVPLRFDEAARLCWVDRYNAHHAEMAAADFDPRLHGAYAKLDGYAARLALILQLARYAAEEVEDASAVDMDSIEAAWTIADYFKHGARRVYGQMGMNRTDKLVQAAIEWMDRHETSELSARDAVRSGVGGIKAASEAKDLFRALTERGYGSVVEQSIGGGKPSRVFRRSTASWKENEAIC